MKIKFKEKLLVAGVLSSLGLGTPLLSVAQSTAAPATTAQSQAQAAQATTTPDMRASQLIGKQVNNAQGDNIGKIDDLIIDADSQRVYYVVLSSGGVLGVGDKLFAIPVNQFKAGAKQDHFVLNIDKERLKKAPGFASDKRPDLGKDSWRREVDRFYFTENKTGQVPTTGARLLSAMDLIGANVNDRAAHNAGEIEDLVVNFGSGRAYAVLDFDAAWSPDDKLIPLPLSAFMFPSRPDLDILLNVDKQKIDMAQGFDDDKWPDLNSPAYQKDITNYLLSFQLQTKSGAGQTQTGRQPATSTGSSQ